MYNEGITGQVKWYRRNKHLRIDGTDGGLPVHGGRGAGQHNSDGLPLGLNSVPPAAEMT